MPTVPSGFGGTGGQHSVPGAGPYVPAAEPDPTLPCSPTELFYSLLMNERDTSQIPYVVVGPATHEQQQFGVVSLTQAGSNQMNPHMPIIWARIQVRCVAHTMAHSELMGMKVRQMFHTRHRELWTQPSSGNAYLVHHTMCLTDPSNHYDGHQTWESLGFYEVMVGTTPVS